MRQSKVVDDQANVLNVVTEKIAAILRPVGVTVAAQIERNHVKAVSQHQRREIPRMRLLGETMQEEEIW